LILGAAAVFVGSLSHAKDVAPAPRSAAGGNAYFPLAVGSSWSYRCSVEGRHQFDKTLRVTSKVKHGDSDFYETEQRIGRDPKPLVFYFTTDTRGNVFRSLKPGGKDRELVITAEPKVGDRVGDRRVAASERMKVAGVGQMKVLRIESFSIDDPALTAEKRAEWQGRFYARGIGQVAEADGIGGDCVLAKFHAAKPL
jgi:hypothetical protein